MAERYPVGVLKDELGNPVGLREFPDGDTLPKSILPELDAADVGADPAGSAASAQAYAIQRENHTGTQPISTVQGLPEALGERVLDDDPRLSDSRTPTGGAGGVLSGQYPNPGFAVPMATVEQLDAKVDKVEGKGLSEEDFTTALRDKLDSLNPGSGGIDSIVAGSGISVDDSDPVNPIVSATGSGGGGGVESIVAGNGINVDDSDPANPVVSAVGGGSGAPGIPTGGTTGQVLTKATAEDFDAVWQTFSGGGGEGGITSPTISRIITSTNPNEPLEDGDLLLVLPQPRVVAASYSSHSYGDSASVSSVSIQVPLETQVGDLIVVLVGSVNMPTMPVEYSLVITEDGPKENASAAGMGRSSVFTKRALVSDAGETVEISQSPSSRMAAMALVLRSSAPGQVNVSNSASEAFTSSDSSDLPHLIPEITAQGPGCLAVVVQTCALAVASGSSVTWPSGWTPISPTRSTGNPSHENLRNWVAYKQLRQGEDISHAGHCTHETRIHDGSSVGVIFEVS